MGLYPAPTARTVKLSQRLDGCRMKEGQDTIYYMAADSKSAAESAPFVEQLVKRNYEVCCL